MCVCRGARVRLLLYNIILLRQYIQQEMPYVFLCAGSAALRHKIVVNTGHECAEVACIVVQVYTN